MKRCLLFVAATVGVFAVRGFAQYAPVAPSPAPTPYPAQPTPYAAQPTPYAAQPAPYAAATAPVLNPQQLDQLLSPIALYPDPLLAAMLPASTFPDQIAAAASFVSANVDPAQIDQQPWDDSVKTLAHYPDVVMWMAQNSPWTSQVGNAVATEEPSVFDSIQRLRANARAAGALVDTPQQQVIVQNNTISIVPAQPGTIYIPSYDPQALESGSPAGFALQFGVGYPLGGWATYGLDWRNHSVWINHNGGNGRFARGRGESREVWRPETSGRRHRQEFSGPARVLQPAPFSARSEHSERVITPTGRPDDRVMNRGRFDERRTTPDQSRRYQPSAPETSRPRDDGADHGGDRDHSDRDRTDRDDRPRGD